MFHLYSLSVPIPINFHGTESKVCQQRPSVGKKTYNFEVLDGFGMFLESVEHFDTADWPSTVFTL